MIKLVASVCIDAPAQTVWERLAALEDIQLWSDLVVHASCEGPLSRGAGASRTCELVGRRTIHERWTQWEEGRSFTYEGFGIPLVQRATNRWTVVPQGEKALVTSEAELEIKGGVVGRAMEPILGPVMRRMAPRALAGFKYLVEQGHPYEGKASALPRPPATC